VNASRTLDRHPGTARLGWRPPLNRRGRLTYRAGPLVAVAALALAGGAVVGALHVPAQERLAERFARAWEREDYASMHRMLSASARTATPLPAFRLAYEETRATATATALTIGRTGSLEDGAVPVPVTVRTRIFGVLTGSVPLAFSGEGDAARVAWRPAMTFPGVGPGERLSRRTELAPRADLLARDGQPLAQGTERTSVIPEVAAQVVGQLGPIPPERRLELRERGLPDGALVGISGLERVFNDRLAGRPGGTLFAGGRVLGTARLRPGRAVRTTIDPELEAATIGALAGRAGAVAVLSPENGEVLALAGVAYSGLGPPGSTFKIITTTAGLEEGAVTVSDEFPVRTAAVLEGVELENANGESCGGSFTDSFAHSCNSVFAPLGAEVGGPRLVEEAEQYGFNRPLGIEGAETSTIPPGDEIGDDLAVGATAIGQGKVQASALQMASVGATIANRGVRAAPTLALGERTRRTRVTTAEFAATVRRLMVGVVKFGTGTAADISGVTVAGKTGTAELGNTTDDEEDTELDTDAWFVAFAPARTPRLAVAVVMFQAGSGGASAAPVAREVLASALSE